MKPTSTLLALMSCTALAGCGMAASTAAGQDNTTVTVTTAAKTAQTTPKGSATPSEQKAPTQKETSTKGNAAAPTAAKEPKTPKARNNSIMTTGSTAALKKLAPDFTVTRGPRLDPNTRRTANHLLRGVDLEPYVVFEADDNLKRLAQDLTPENWPESDDVKERRAHVPRSGFLSSEPILRIVAKVQMPPGSDDFEGELALAAKQGLSDPMFDAMLTVYDMGLDDLPNPNLMNPHLPNIRSHCYYMDVFEVHSKRHLETSMTCFPIKRT